MLLLSAVNQLLSEFRIDLPLSLATTSHAYSDRMIIDIWDEHWKSVKWRPSPVAIMLTPLCVATGQLLLKHTYWVS